ncbi:MAG: hypothetical protein Q7T68_06585 [Sphingopyxis sp.]|nr:hypothetical protein [Sphingopyxis sp.]
MHLPLKALDHIVQRGHLGTMVGAALGDGGIARRHEPGLDELEQFADGGFDASAFGARLLEVARTALIGLVRSLEDMGQQLAEPVGFEKAEFQLCEHDLVELFLPNALAGATARGPVRLGVAGIIAIAAALTRADRQPVAAAGHLANGQAGQQRAPVGDSRRRLCRRRLGARRSHSFGLLRLDDTGTFNPNAILRPRNAAIIIGRLVRVSAEVVRPSQNAVDRAVKEGLPPPRVTVGFQPFGDSSRPHRLAAKAIAGEIVDAANNGGLVLDDHKFLAFFTTVSCGSFRLVAVGHGAAVPITGARVGSTVAPGKQGRIVGIFFVHDRNHAAHHLAVRTLAEIFGYGGKAYTCRLQSMFAHDLCKQAPGKAVEIIDNDNLHRVLGAGREIDHLVKLLTGKFAA